MTHPCANRFSSRVCTGLCTSDHRSVTGIADCSCSGHPRQRKSAAMSAVASNTPLQGKEQNLFKQILVRVIDLFSAWARFADGCVAPARAAAVQKGAQDRRAHPEKVPQPRRYVHGALARADMVKERRVLLLVVCRDALAQGLDAQPPEPQGGGLRSRAQGSSRRSPQPHLCALAPRL